jgi:hypothetical protein
LRFQVTVHDTTSVAEGESEKGLSKDAVGKRKRGQVSRAHRRDDCGVG